MLPADRVTDSRTPTAVNICSSTCAKLLPALKQQGVRTEIATGSGNCSIDSMRTLWRDLTISPRQLLAAVLAANADGLNIDFEPQANHCQGGAARNHSRVLVAVLACPLRTCRRARYAGRSISFARDRRRRRRRCGRRGPLRHLAERCARVASAAWHPVDGGRGAVVPGAARLRTCVCVRACVRACAHAACVPHASESRPT